MRSHHKASFAQGTVPEENEMAVNQVEEYMDADQLSKAGQKGKDPVSALSQRMPGAGQADKQAMVQTATGAVSKLSVDQVIANVLKKAKAK